MFSAYYHCHGNLNTPVLLVRLPRLYGPFALKNAEEGAESIDPSTFSEIVFGIWQYSRLGIAFRLLLCKKQIYL